MCYLSQCRLQSVAGVVLLAALCAPPSLQAQPAPPGASVQGIYTCVDARGRKLTSDRPIAECTDREQQVLNPSGTVRAKLPPTLTAHERAAQEAKEKAAQEELARLAEEKRRDRALLMRYPNRAVHDKERAQALAQIKVVRQASVQRVEELQRQRAVVTAEMEFYKKDPSKAPPSVRRELDDLTHSLAVQERFIADQDAELKRVDARFDDEVVRLKQLWASVSAPPAAAAPSKAR